MKLNHLKTSPIPFSQSQDSKANLQTTSPSVISTFQSIALATHQEYIELDSFNDGIARFSLKEFKEAGIDEKGVELLRYFAQQEAGHTKVLSNLLGAPAPKQCKYDVSTQTSERRSIVKERRSRTTKIFFCSLVALPFFILLSFKVPLQERS